MNIFFICFIASVALFIKDWIEAKDFSKVKDNWKKYVGCIVCGLIYGYLSGWKYFNWLSILAIIYLTGNFFNNVLNALNWVLKKFGSKKTI